MTVGFCPVMVEHEQPDGRRQIAVWASGIDLGDDVRQCLVALDGDLLEPLPEGVFKANAGLMTGDNDRAHNVEVMWLVGRLVPDQKTIDDFRKDNGSAIRQVCVRSVALCRTMGLLTQASVAIDGSKFKAVNTIATGTLRGPRWIGGWRRSRRA
jgi:hypothetical protein